VLVSTIIKDGTGAVLEWSPEAVEDSAVVATAGTKNAPGSGLPLLKRPLAPWADTRGVSLAPLRKAQDTSPHGPAYEKMTQ